MGSGAAVRNRVRSPDGREWDVRAFRVRLPGWHPWDVDPWDESDPWWTAVLLVAQIPAVTVVPLIRFLGELPIAVARSMFTKTRWVEAACTWPAEIRIVWRTTTPHVSLVVQRVIEQIAQGYEHVNPEHAELVEMTRPPGLGDRDA